MREEGEEEVGWGGGLEGGRRGLLTIDSFFMHLINQSVNPTYRWVSRTPLVWWLAPGKPRWVVTTVLPKQKHPHRRN